MREFECLREGERESLSVCLREGECERESESVRADIEYSEQSFCERFSDLQSF